MVRLRDAKRQRQTRAIFLRLFSFPLAGWPRRLLISGRAESSLWKIARFWSRRPIAVSPLPERVSLTILSDITGYSASHIANLVSKGFVPRPVNAEYALVASVRAIVEHAKRDRASSAAMARDENLAARTELLKVKTQLAEMDRKFREGELVSAAEVEVTVGQMYSFSREHLLSWAGKLPSILEGLTMLEMRRVLRDEVTHVIAELHDEEVIPRPPNGTKKGKSHAAP
jgi:hypothetical protein